VIEAVHQQHASAAAVFREVFAVVDNTFSGPSLRPALTNPSHPFAGRVVLCQESVGLLPAHVEPLLAALRWP
jgi:hypothetical protein